MKGHFSIYHHLLRNSEGRALSSAILRLFFLGMLAFFSMNANLNAQCQTCCNGSKPKALVMIYNGKSCSESVTCQADGKWSCTGSGPNNAASVYIKVAEKSDGTGKIFFTGTVNLNAEFTVTSAAGGSSTFPSNLYFLVSSSQGGTLLQTVKVHTSCSTPLVAGDQFGSVFLKTITLADNTVCNSTPPGCSNVTCPGVVAGNETFCAPFDPALITETTPACTTVVNPPPPATDCCDGSKPKSTILKYTGQGCSASNTTQPLGNKYNCADFGGGPNGDPSVYITVTKNSDGSGGTYFAGTVGINEDFTANSISGGSNTFPSNVYFTIYASQGGAVLQKVQIHYSCSAPLVPGEQFGSLVLRGVTFEDNTVCGEGSSGGGSGGTDCCNGSKPKSATLLYNGQGCGSSNTSQPLGKYNCTDLGGGPNGDPSVYIIASKNSDGSGGTYFAGTVAINTTFTMTSAAGGSSTFPSNVYYNIYSVQGGTLLQKVQIHYSCSAPLVPGDQFGSLVLQSLIFADNTVCGIQPPPNVDVEYKWLKSTTGCPTNLNQAIAGATSKTFDPPSISQTTWYVRLVRRVGCTADNEWLASNCVVKKVVNVNAAISNIVCDGKGTSTTTDDTYTFVLTVTGSGGGTTWQGGFSNACLGAFAIGPTAYGTPITLGPFPAGAGSCGNTSPPIQFQNGLNIDVSVADTENPTCSKNTTVVSPGPCSPGAVAGLGDFVWNDLNQNGAQNAGEPGVQGVTVNLYKCDGTFMGTTVTNATGFYSFNNLTPNMQYFVEFTNLPGGFQFSPKDAAADNIDSDANTGNGRTDCTFLSPGEFDNTIDAGIFQSVQQVGSIGDCVWNDVNQNGLKDIGEPGVPGVTVKLLNCAGAVLQTTTTNANGNYSFNNLPAGSYIVEFSGLPSGFQFTTKDAGNDSADSDANPANGRTDCFNLALGQNDPTRDAGIFQPTPQPASVGDFVWNDLDKDGVQDAGEPGVQGVLVKLFRCDNSFIGQFTTTATGFYQFINLSPGSYFVQFMNLPAGFQFTNKDAGADDAKDSDADPATGNTVCFNLVSGQNDPTRDAGVFQSTGTGPGTVGDFVWFDTNANGIQDAGEPGVSGIFVILETCAGQFVNFAVTNALGGYLITNVPAGSYRVKFASPGSINGSPVQFTVKDAGGDDTKDSDADNLGFSACFNLAAGQSNLTLDAGFVGQTPPQVCVINGSVSNVTCNANGTVSFTIVVNGTNTGDWGYDIPALNQFTLQYGQPYNFSIPGSANPTVLQIVDHDVADCKTTVSITSPAPCNTGGGGTPTGCDAVTFTGGAGSITVSGLSSPIEIVKVFNAAWQTVFECSANCNNPTVANNLPAGTYFVKVQLFTSTWGLICTKEGYVNVSNFNGGNGNEMVVNPGNGSEPQQAAPQLPGTSVSERTGEDAIGETAKTASLDLFPNPAQGYAIVNWGEAADWQQAELTLFNSLGQAVQKVTLDNAGEGSYRLDLSGLQGGQYVVRFRADAAAPIVKKLVVSR